MNATFFSFLKMVLIKCVVARCRSTYNKADKNRAFHYFPKDESLKNQWIDALQKKEGVSKTARICSEHFLDQDYKTKAGRWILEKNAVPSLNLGIDDIELTPPPKRKRSNSPRGQVETIIACVNGREPLPSCSQASPGETSNRGIEIDSHDSPQRNRTPSSPIPGILTLATMLASAKTVDPEESQDEELKKKCEKLSDQLEKKNRAYKNLWMKYSRLKKKVKAKCQNCETWKSKLDSKCIVEIPQGRFNDDQISVLHGLLSKKSKQNRFTEHMKGFAHGLFYYSPKAYNHVSKFFTLPHPSTIRKLLAKIDCWPGFLQPAFKELSERVKGENGLMYQDGALAIDAITIKKFLQFEPRLGRGFGYVDFGGIFGVGAQNILAKDALFAMVTGLRSFWKLPVAWFLIDGVSAKELAEIIKLSIYKCQEVGVRIRTTVMDGTTTNFSAFNNLGCNLKPERPCEMKTSFPHPHPDIEGPVYALMDPGHMIKNVRNLFKHYGNIIWDGRGVVRWKYLEILENTQAMCGFRLGNKVTARHVNFEKLKMKVKLATQLLSDSVARVLRWAYHEKIEGFEEDDVLITAEFLDIHDKMFDICNSRSRNAYGYKAALRIETFHYAEEIFQKLENMYENCYVVVHDGRKKVQDYTPVPLLRCERQAGPWGLISCAETYRNLVSDTVLPKGNPSLKMKWICTAKAQQDHLETYFSALRANKNGSCRNPTASQCRYSVRSMLMHAGKYIAVMTGNCEVQEEVLLNVSNTIRSRVDFLSNSDEELDRMLAQVRQDHSYSQWEDDEVQKKNTVMHHRSSCIVDECKVCSAAIAYIAGFYVFKFEKLSKCIVCRKALESSEMDPCPNNSLIKFKNYTTKEGAGLKTPSGSLCKLLYLCEKVMRKNINFLHQDKIEERLLIQVLSHLDRINIFSSLAQHALDTFLWADNDYLTMIRLISKKYFRLRIKKILKDEAVDRSAGNSIDRIRIFSGL